MSNILPNARELFLHAVGKLPSEQWKNFVAQACRGDLDLEKQVGHLLKVHLEAGSFLNVPAEGLDATLYQLSSERPGTQIGPYKIREELAEGGMGVVYVAEQLEPVRRKVALKIIKPGMATKEIVARFESERQALAVMEHPHIARVFDGGVTESGLPFFVMELVQGPPVTEYCDEHLLTTQERLRLFIKICRAVQHAHQKGIIHRDLKPSNVLVSEIDDEAVPKVIDFGIAKAVNQKLSDQTVYTQFSQVIGTPQYMSPEQAGRGVPDVDTRSDVYSLGVMLYELLTGSTPFDAETSKAAGLDEMRRVIREQEPTKPSAMVRTLKAQALSTVAERRRTDSRKLGDSLKGELDWIVMRALEKDRNRRYETASDFATDIERYLNQEPIAAGPPSVAYKAKKYIQRNRAKLSVTTAIFLLCSFGVGYFIIESVRAAKNRRDLIAAIERSINAAELSIDSENFATARQQLGEAQGQLKTSAQNLRDHAEIIAELSDELDQRIESQLRYGKFHKDAKEVIDYMFAGSQSDAYELAKLALESAGIKFEHDWDGSLEDALMNDEQRDSLRNTAYELLLLLAVQQSFFGTEEKKKAGIEGLRYAEMAKRIHPATRAFFWVQQKCCSLIGDESEKNRNIELYQSTPASSAFDYFLPGQSAAWGGDLDEAIRLYKAALRIQPDHFPSLFFLAYRQIFSRPDEAAQVFRACLALRPDHVSTLRNRAIALHRHGENEEALEQATKAIVLSPESPSSYETRGSIYLSLREHDKALDDLSKTLEFTARMSKKDAAFAYNNVAWVLTNCPNASFRDVPRALVLANQAVELAPKYRAGWNTLGIVQYRSGDYESAIASLQKSIEFHRSVDAYDALFLAMSHSQLGEPEQAKDWYAKALQWLNNKNSTNEELLRFKTEAEQTLGIQTQVDNVGGPQTDPESKSHDAQNEASDLTQDLIEN